MRHSSTPSFSALGPLLFGRPPCSELKRLQAQAQGTDAISELRKALGQFVPDALFSQDKKGARQRLFTPLVTFWAFLSQVLSPERACRDAVRKAQAWWSLGRRRPISANTSAYCQARTRLVTTLLDPIAFPAEALGELYFQRWSVELHFREIKTLLRLDTLRCRTPKGHRHQGRVSTKHK